MSPNEERLPGPRDDSEPRSGPGPQARQEQVRSFFELAAGEWETMYRRRDVLGTVHQRRLQRTLELVDTLGLPVGARALELGCGAGITAVELARDGFDVQATDVVEAMLARTRERVMAAGVQDRVIVTHADAQQLPFADSSFDLVVALGVMPWVDKPLQVAREILRVLRPGGRAILTVGNRWRLAFLLDPVLNPGLALARRGTKALLARMGRPVRPRSDIPANLFRAPEFGRLLEDAGLEVISAETLGFGPITFWRREILPRGSGLRLDALLQRQADRGLPVIRSLGAQHLFLARRRL